jgi:TolA-binding protein
MRDPERLTSSKGLSDLERELLDAGKNETMPAALREQMERALGLYGAPAAGGQVRARVEAATGVKASAIVWISAGVVVLGVVGGLVGVRLGSRLFSPGAVVPVAAPAAPEQPARVAAPSVAGGEAARVVAVAAPAGSDGAPGLGASAPAATPPPRRSAAPVRLHSRAHAAASHAGTARAAGTPRNHALSSSSSSESVAPVESAAAAADAPVAEAPARAVAPSEPKPSAKKVSPARAAVAPPGDLRAEIDLIDGARAALRAGDTAQAMDLLGQHAMHFPHGALAPEETALRVEALMRMGRTAEAKAYARRFVAANPASPLAERMRRLVNSDTAP